MRGPSQYWVVHLLELVYNVGMSCRLNFDHYHEGMERKTVTTELSNGSQQFETISHERATEKSKKERAPSNILLSRKGTVLCWLRVLKEEMEEVVVCRSVTYFSHC